MKRMLIAMAALGLATGAARADWGGPGAAPTGGPPTGAGAVPQLGGPNTVMGLGDPYNGVEPDKYGLHPRLKRLFRLSPKAPNYAQMGYGQTGPAYNPMGYPGGYAPAQGTLAFPNHPFVRSPRDYFMLDVNK